MKKHICTVLTLAFVFVLAGCNEKEKVFGREVKLGSKKSLTPAKSTPEWWVPRHESVIQRVKAGNVDLIMVGDSITHHWEDAGNAVWNKYYAERNAVNMGFGGDRTQHVLWRLENGEIDGISPKLAIVLIGTNNANNEPPCDIVDGIAAICQKIRNNLPDTKILLLAIFPRTYKSERMPIITEVNKALPALADNKHIYFLNISKKIIGPDGVISKDIMPDGIHLSEKGYEIWAKSMNPMIEKLMQN